MGYFYQGVHYSYETELGPNERFGIEDEMSFQELALKLEAEKKARNIENTSVQEYSVNWVLIQQKKNKKGQAFSDLLF